MWPLKLLIILLKIGILNYILSNIIMEKNKNIFKLWLYDINETIYLKFKKYNIITYDKNHFLDFLINYIFINYE